MRSAVPAVSISVISLLLAVPAAQRLFAAPMSGTVHVAVSPGGKFTPTTGGTSASLNFGYEPARVTIKVGTTVVWTNKATLPEPHFVTFLEPDPKTGEMKGGPPWLIVRPKAGKEGSKNPADLEFIENTLYVLPSEVTGAPFRNSGFLWPAKMGPPGSQSSWQYTFTEMDAGKTLRYTCVIHPWMTGTVVVVR